jgi:hypothetical protein
MKHQVEVMLRLSLWIDASLAKEQLSRFVRDRLLAAFGDSISAMLDPVRILRLREEAEIFGEQAEPVPFDAFEVHGVREFEENGHRWIEQVDEQYAQMWSLYGHIPGRGLECIGDFATREFAEEVLARIEGPCLCRTKCGHSPL